MSSISFFHLILKKIKIAIREEERQGGGKRVKGVELVSFVLLMYFILWRGLAPSARLPQKGGRPFGRLSGELYGGTKDAPAKQWLNHL